MFDILHTWAAEWQFSQFAVLDLMTRLGAGYEPYQPDGVEGWSETAMSNLVRINAAKVGILAWRNNVGVLNDERGVPVRFGLCNDTKKLNTNIKSDWRYTGQGREPAQLKWGQIIIANGGDAAFTTGGL